MNVSPWDSARTWAIFSLIGWMALVSVSGCSSKPLKSDANRAKELLTETLDAWKQGKSISSLKEQVPPIFVGDERWQRGVKLNDFTIKEGDFFESSVRFPVTLKIAGESKPREVLYWVSTNPSSSVTLGE